MRYKDCEKLVIETYKKIKAFTSLDAVTVTMMIIAHESLRGQYRRQVGAGFPALGLGQMEEATFNTCRDFGDRYKTYLLRAGYNPDTVKFSQLETDDTLAIILIRVRLAMDPAKLPDSLIEQANFCKRFWNGGGKASAEKYLTDYQVWKNE